MNGAGLYIHIPFCKNRCNYCDFFSSTDQESIDRYVDEAVKEITLVSKRFPAKIETIYFGGGTPSLLSLSHFDKIFSAIHSSFSVESKETTIEVNPNSSGDLAEYKKFGIDRVSIGIQTLDPVLLRKIGRLHTPEEGIDALLRAREVYDNVSADLIIGLDGKQDVERDVYSIAPYCTHVSGYMLSVPKKSKIENMIKSEEFFPANDDQTVDQYDILTNTCRELGFYRYETSNYARLGKEGIHNGNYWAMRPYIGIGPSAHSYFNGVRYYNVNDLKKYLSGCHSGGCKEKIERKYSVEDEITETIMLSLRTAKGIDIRSFNEKFHSDFLKKYEKGIDAVKKYVSITNNRLYILPKYFSVQNQVILSILTH